MMTIEIENNIKYRLTRSHFSKNVFWRDEVQRKNQCHKECLISNQQIGTTIVVSHFAENSKLKTFKDEVSL